MRVNFQHLFMLCKSCVESCEPCSEFGQTIFHQQTFWRMNPHIEGCRSVHPQDGHLQDITFSKVSCCRKGGHFIFFAKIVIGIISEWYLKGSINYRLFGLNFTRLSFHFFKGSIEGTKFFLPSPDP